MTPFFIETLAAEVVNVDYALYVASNYLIQVLPVGRQRTRKIFTTVSNIIDRLTRLLLLVIAVFWSVYFEVSTADTDFTISCQTPSLAHRFCFFSLNMF